MRDAELIDDIHRLLRMDWAVADEEGLTRRRNVWFEIKESADERAGYLADIDIGWDVADEEARSGSPDPADRAIGLGLRYALIRASLSSMAANIPSGLLLTLTRKGSWSTSRAFSTALQLGDRAEVVTALAGLADIFVRQGRAEDLMVAAEGFDDAERARVLSAIAAVAPPMLVDDVLAATDTMRDEAAQVLLLTALAGRLPQAKLDRVINAAARLTKEASQAAVLTSVIPHASDEQIVEITAAAERLPSRWRIHLLLILAAHLPEAQVRRLLMKVDRPRSSLQAVEVAAALADRLPEPDRSTWFARRRKEAKRLPVRQRARISSALGDDATAKMAATRVRGLHDRTKLLTELAPTLDGEEMADLLPSFVKRLTAAEAGRAYESFAPFLPRDIIPRALELVDADTGYDGRLRARALIALAPRLSGDLARSALALALTIADVERRAQVIEALAPHLDAAAFDEILATIKTARKVGARPRLLASVVAHLSGEQLHDAFWMATRIGIATDRSRSIGVLAPYLPDELLDKAETGLESINDVHLATEVLALLEGTRQMPGPVTTGTAETDPTGAFGLRVIGALMRLPADEGAFRSIESQFWEAGLPTMEETLTTLAPQVRDLREADFFGFLIGHVEVMSGFNGPAFAKLHALASSIPGPAADGLLAIRRQHLLDKVRALDDWDDPAGSWASFREEYIEDIDDDPGRSRLAVDLATVGLDEQADVVLRSTKHAGWRIEALVRILKVAPAEERPDLLDRILADLQSATLTSDYWDMGSPKYLRVGIAALGDLGTFLARPDIDRVLEMLSAVPSDWSRGSPSVGDIGLKSLIQAETGLARFADAAMRHAVVTRGLKLAPRIRDPRIRELASTHLARCLEKESIAAWTTSVRQLPPLRRAEAYEQLAIRLGELDDPVAAFEVTVGIESPGPRRRAFDVVGPRLAALPREELFHLWVADVTDGGVAHRLGVGSRPMLLADIAALAPAIGVIGGATATAETAQAIRDVTEWWP
jgi:hypothetical protein